MANRDGEGFVPAGDFTEGCFSVFNGTCLRNSEDVQYVVMKPAGGSPARWWGHIVPLFLFVVLAAAWFWPVLQDMDDNSPVGWDPKANPWKLWWAKKAIVDLHHSPYWCEYVFHPKGLTLLFWNPSPLYGLLSLPVTAQAKGFGTFQLVANFWVFLSFPLSAFLAYLLCYRICRNRLAALIGGFLFGFSPWRVGLPTTVNMLSTYWLPLFFLIVTGGENGHGRSWKRGLMTGLCYVGAFLTSLTTFMLLLFGSAAIVLYRLPHIVKGRHVKREGAFWIAGMLPLFFCALLIAGSSPHEVFKMDQYEETNAPILEKLSLDPGSLLVPGDNSLLARFRPDSAPRPRDDSYVGWTVVVWIILGIALFPFRGRGFYILLLLLSLTLSFGPVVRLGVNPSDIILPMPYKILQIMGPPMSFFRTPIRFMFLGSLLTSLFASLGVASIARYARHLSPWKGRIVGLGLLAGVALTVGDQWPGSVRSVKHLPNESIVWLKSQVKKPGSVLILPAKRYRDLALNRTYQVIFDRPIPVAHMIRADHQKGGAFPENALLRMLVFGEEDDQLHVHELAELAESEIAYVVAHRSELIKRPYLASFFKRNSLFPSVEDSHYQVFEVPPYPSR